MLASNSPKSNKSQDDARRRRSPYAKRRNMQVARKAFVFAAQIWRQTQCYNSINAESALGGSAGVIGRVSETWVGLDDSFERCDLE